MEPVKEIILSFSQGLLAGILLNGSVIALAYYLFWKKFKIALQNWRIQVPQRADARQIRAELRNALPTFIVGALFSAVVLYASTKGNTKIYSRFSDHHPLVGIGGFFVLLLIDDAWFYWVHRLLHHPAIFRLVHVVHHRSVDVNPFTSLSFCWVEPFLLTCWIFPVAFFIPVYAPVLGVVQLWGLLENVKSHLGYELYPAWFNRSWLRMMTTSTHHNMHHSKFKGNYGVHFRFWDRLMGTEFRGYEDKFDDIQERKRRGR